MTVWGTIVTGTVLAAMEFSDFLCARYDATPPKLQKNTMAALLPYPYVTDRAAALEVLSLQVKTKCVTISFTLIDDPYPIYVYTVKPLYTRATADHMRRYIRVGSDWRQEVMFSSEYYGRSRLTPSPELHLEMMIYIPTSISQ